MKTEKWDKLNEIFHKALELPKSERNDFIKKESGEDSDLINEVENLIASAESETDFLNENAIGNVENYIPFVEDLNGKTIGHYKIIEEIGRGGMGAVFLAERADKEFDQKVALKIVHNQFANEALIERFRNERQILASLKHPNIAHLIDGGTTESGLPYFVMEYVEGETLIDYCDKNKLTINERLKLFQKICSAVSHAHKNLIIHRDIKPTNILVTKDGIPKLLDFGIAKPFSLNESDQATLTQTGGRMLTPDYASPEQVSGEMVTTSTDVYSSGVVLYELLTGHRPYQLQTQNPFEAFKIICEQEPVRPSNIVGTTEEKTFDKSETKKITPQTVGENRKTQPESLSKQLSGDIDNILLKSLRKEPERRYDSVNEFVEDIKRYQNGLPVNATADSKTYRIKKFVKRHTAGTLMAVFATLLLISATAITSWQYFKAQKAQTEAEQRFNDVRQLANSIVFELHDSIKDLPGSTPAREKLVTRALEYLDKLASANSSDPTLLLELADAYEKIGDIQGGMHETNLGKRELAFDSYQKSLDIRETLVNKQPNNDEYRRKLADSFYKVANIYNVQLNLPKSVEMYQKALEIHKKFYSEKPDDKSVVMEYAQVNSRYGFTVAASGKIDEGLIPLQESVNMMEELNKKKPDDDEILDRLSLCYDLHAVILEGGKSKYAEALAIYQKSHEIIKKLHLKDPKNTQMKRIYAVTFYNVADMLEKLERFDESLPHSQKALEIMNELQKNDPKSGEFKTLTSAFEIQVSGLIARKGKTDVALRIMDSSMQKLEKAFKESPSDAVIENRIAVAHERYGQIYSLVAEQTKNPNDLQKACSHYQKSYVSFKKFKDEGKAVGEDAAKVDKVAKELEKCGVSNNS